MISRLSGPLYKITIFFGTLFLVNTLIFLTNIPFVFSLVFIPLKTENLIPIFLTAIPLGPALVGGYAVIWRYMCTGEYSVWQRFWQGYKTNFWQTIGLSALVAIFISLLTYNLQLMMASGRMTLFFYPTLILLGGLIPIFFVACLLISRFEMSGRNIAINTLFFMIQNPLKSLMALLVIVVFYLVVALTAWKVLYLLLFSLPLYLLLINYRELVRLIEIEKGFEY